MLTQKKVRKLFDYQDGQLIRLVRVANCTKIGDVIGYKDPKGYSRVHIEGKVYLVHRLIFLWHHGYIPKEIDHLDRDPSNNKIENLRPCTRSQNKQNTKLRLDNTSGIKGVTWRKDADKWQAELSVDGRRIRLGFFDDLSIAETAIRAARIKHHGEFTNHG